MRNQDKIELNELNKNSNGGTELTTRALFDFLDEDDLEGIQIITARVRDLDMNRLRIYHLHDLALDPEAAHLKDEDSRSRFHKLVFSSNWQYQQYRDYLGVPYDARSTVINTGVEPIELLDKPKGTIRLIYTSTPHRGLEILVPVFEELCKRHDDIELDVYSSFGIYGWQERDKPYEQLFERMRVHPKMHYHGWQPNDIVRSAYQRAHIFAYPCIWPETSCRSLIEAMSAGCLCVHPNFSALPETSGGLTYMYDGDHADMNRHAHIFYNVLESALDMQRSMDLSATLAFNKISADSRFSWQQVGEKWKTLIQSLKAQYDTSPRAAQS